MCVVLCRAKLSVVAVCCAASLVALSRCIVPVVACCLVLVRVSVCCAVSLVAALHRAALRRAARRCAVVRWVVLPGSVCCRRLLCHALGHCPSLWGVVSSGALVCGISLRCVLRPVCVVPWCVGACCCSPLSVVLNVSLGVVLDVLSSLRSERCCAAVPWCACVVLFLWSVLFLVPGAVVRCCVLCPLLWCAVVRCCAALLGACCDLQPCASPCSPAFCHDMLRPPAWVSPCSGRLAPLLCGAGCCAALLSLGALLPCAVPLGAVLPSGAVLSCPAALFALLPVCVCLLPLSENIKPLLYPSKFISAFENEMKLYNSQGTPAGRQQDHVCIAVLRVTLRPRWLRGH